MKPDDVNNEIERMTNHRMDSIGTMEEQKEFDNKRNYPLSNPVDLVFRLRKRAEIRRQIPSRKSVQENQPDRLSDLLEEAAEEIERLINLNRR